MARKLRLQYEGAVYHVINRGNYRRDKLKGSGDKLKGSGLQYSKNEVDREVGEE
jgi:REP element-mobilizing transposase RayT